MFAVLEGAIGFTEATEGTLERTDGGEPGIFFDARISDPGGAVPLVKGTGEDRFPMAVPLPTWVGGNRWGAGDSIATFLPESENGTSRRLSAGERTCEVESVSLSSVIPAWILLTEGSISFTPPIRGGAAMEGVSPGFTLIFFMPPIPGGAPRIRFIPSMPTGELTKELPFAEEALDTRSCGEGSAVKNGWVFGEEVFPPFLSIVGPLLLFSPIGFERMDAGRGKGGREGGAS